MKTPTGSSITGPAFLALVIWLAVTLILSVSFLFWRIGYVRPHWAWGVSSLFLVAAPLAGIVTVAIWRLVKGPDRLHTVGWLLIGLTPLVWFGSYSANLRSREAAGEAIAFNIPLRVVMTWVSSGTLDWKVTLKVMEVEEIYELAKPIC